MSPKEGMFWAGFIGTTAAIAFSLQVFFHVPQLWAALCGAIPGFLVGSLLQQFYVSQVRKSKMPGIGEPMAKTVARCRSCRWEGDPQMASNCPVCGARLEQDSGDADNPFRL